MKFTVCQMQDFASMHVFMLPGLRQTISKPAVLWLLNMFFFYPSAVILQFKFFGSHILCFESNLNLAFSFVFSEK